MREDEDVAKKKVIDELIGDIMTNETSGDCKHINKKVHGLHKKIIKVVETPIAYKVGPSSPRKKALD